MKILMVLETMFPPDERVEKEALGLISSGHELHLLCPTFDRSEVKESEYKGIILHKVLITPFMFKKMKALCLQFPIYFNYWKTKVRRIMEKEHFDAIHIHDLPLAVVGSYAQEKFGVKWILDLHENYPYLVEMSPYSKQFLGRMLISIDKWKRYEQRMVCKADRVITVCEEMSDRLRLLVQRNYCVVENTVSPELFPLPVKREKKNDKIHLVYVGGVNYHRGLQVAIEGLSLLKDKERFCLDIFGKGSYLNELKQLTVRLGIQNMVHFGFLKYPEEASKLCDYDLGLIPHLRSVQTDYSSPNKIYQYFYYGLPVMTSDMISIKNIIEKDQLGITYKDDSPVDFAQKLEQFLAMDWKSMSERAADMAIGRYSWNRTVLNLQEMYANL